MTTSSAGDRVRRSGDQRRNTHQEKPRGYGRVAEAPTITTYVHDAVGNLRGVELPDGTEIEYLVDGEGRRVGKKVDGVLVRGWLWSGKLRPVAELNAAGAVTKRFVYADGVNVPELMVTSGATYRLVKDHLGSVRRVVDVATGVVLQAIEYDAWGRVLSDTNPGAQPFGFVGGLYDADTGQVRFGAREYDAEIGRWLSKDPIRFAGGDSNIYAYVGNDPVNRSDPRGLDPEFCNNLWSGELDRCTTQCVEEANSQSTFDKLCEGLGLSEESESAAECIRKCGEAVTDELRRCYEPYHWPTNIDEPDWNGGPCYDWECVASR